MTKQLMATLAVVVTILAGAGACGSTDESAAQQRKEKTDAQRKVADAHKQVLVEHCATDTQALRNALQDLNSRIEVGLSYSDYGTKIGDASSAFTGALNGFKTENKAGTIARNCLADVLTPLAAEVDLHAATAKIWEDCINDYSCDINKGTSADKMQSNWQRTAKLSQRAENRLANLKVEDDE